MTDSEKLDKVKRLRGYPIYCDGQQFRFCDTNEPTVTTWKLRPCGHCGLYDTPDGHDGCIGELPNVMNACCGHGNNVASYIQFSDGTEIRGTADQNAMDIYRDESTV